MGRPWRSMSFTRSATTTAELPRCCGLCRHGRTMPPRCLLESNSAGASLPCLKRRSSPSPAGTSSTSSTASIARALAASRDEPRLRESGDRQGARRGTSRASRPAPVLRRPRPQGRLRRHAGGQRPEGDPRDPDGHPGLAARPGARADLLVLLDHRGLRIRPRRRGVRRASSANARASTPRARIYKTKVAAVRPAARAHEPAAALSRVPRLALRLLLPDEQDAPGRPELVPPAVRGRGPS